jgi:hypothetical protein
VSQIRWGTFYPPTSASACIFAALDLAVQSPYSGGQNAGRIVWLAKKFIGIDKTTGYAGGL